MKFSEITRFDQLDLKEHIYLEKCQKSIFFFHIFLKYDILRMFL